MSSTHIVSLSNETTASAFSYEVSEKILSLLVSMSEAELSEAMPRQSPAESGYEEIAYANALMTLAKDRGIPDEDISVRPKSIPVFFFDTGWKYEADSEWPHAGDVNGGTVPNTADAKEADPITEGNDDSFLRAVRNHGDIPQETIDAFIASHTIIDTQYEEDSEGNLHLAKIYQIGNSAVAIHEEGEEEDGEATFWARPFEVIRVYGDKTISVSNWVPIEEL